MAIQFRTRSKAIQPNPDSRGACCIFNETSSSYDCSDDVSFIECKKDLGIFRGQGSQCDDTTCPTNFTEPGADRNGDGVGACKKCSSCSDGVSENNCITAEDFDAEFFGNKTCAQVERDKLSSLTAIKYACCLDDGCFDTCNPTLCADLGGVFHDGVGTPLEQQCESNPCGGRDQALTNELGACCFNQSCLGTLTEQDCSRNGGSWKGIGTDCSSWNCVLNESTENSTQNQDRPPTQGSESGGSIVCSIPSPKKYYNNGVWNNIKGPTYGREKVVVRLYSTVDECILAGGIVGSEDGDTNKVIMWGGCQYYDGQIYKCESKTYDQCRGLSGSWRAGVYCDDIRSYPASGLLLATSMPSGLNQNEKYLAGRCYISDNVISGSTDNTENKTICYDMMTEYQCDRELQKKMDYYLAIIDEGTNVGFDLDSITANDGILEYRWQAGKKCTDCTNGNVPVVDTTLGMCRVSTSANGNYTEEDGSVVNYANSPSGEQTRCISNYTKSDCDAIIGSTWQESCSSCEESAIPTPTKTGSCCTDPSTCLDNLTKEQCNEVGGYFHGLNTKCVIGSEGLARDCGQVAYLTTEGIENLTDVFCRCAVSDDPNASDSSVVQIFARQDSQDGNNIWAGSTCGDPTVDAYPYWEQETNFAKHEFVLNQSPIAEGVDQKFAGVQSIAPFRYNIAGGNGFRDFIISGTGDVVGSFLDDILIQGSLSAYFQVDGVLPTPIPYQEETLKNIRGTTLATNQPADTIHRLILNKPGFYFDDGPVPSDRKITYVNLEGMTNLREFAVQGNNWTTMQADFEAQQLSNLRMLDARSSGLTSLSFAKCPAIEQINLGNNTISTLDLSANEYITDVNVPNNTLSSLNCGIDKIYVSRLNVAYNQGLSSITGSYPQLEFFFGARCAFGNIEFRGMPFLKVVDLTGNPLKTVKIDTSPMINQISLDAAVTPSTILGECILPSRTNRNMSNPIPTAIEEAVIPNPFESMDYFSFRNNILSSTDYNSFVPMLCETIMATKSSSLTNTTFPVVGSFADTATSGTISSRYINLSNVTDTLDDIDNPTNSSVLELLNYIFSLTDVVSHEENITINLTGINTSVYWDVDGVLRSNLNGPLVGRITFIV